MVQRISLPAAVLGILFSAASDAGKPAGNFGAPLPTDTAPRIWVSLGHSTLDERPPDWSWLRSQCASGKLLTTLAPARSRLAGIVLPVFDDGRAFYQTAVPMFKDRNPEAAADEAALRDLLRTAKVARVPVYLGVDPLAWQRSDVEDPLGLLTRRAALQELGQYGRPLPRPEARYASPSHPEVRRTIQQLVRELGKSFPEAAGIALDIRFGDRQIFGFSEASRGRFAQQHALDPLDFQLDNIAGLHLNPTLKAWTGWKRDTLRAFAEETAAAYRSSRPEGRVLLNGYAEYYAAREFHEIRTAQDWLGWSRSGKFDGVLLEGRWLAPFPDLDHYSRLRNELAKAAASARKPLFLLPVSTGDHLIRTSSYRREAGALAGRTGKLDTLVLLAREERDLERVLSFASGMVLPERLSPLAMDAPAPDFVLPRVSGGEWSLKSVRGRMATELIAVRDSRLVNAVRRALAARAQEWLARGVQSVLVSASAGGPEKGPAGLVDVRDPRGVVLSRLPQGVTRVSVDRAGYVRRIQPLPLRDEELRTVLSTPPTDLTPGLEEGRPAPEFSLLDATGQEVRLADYRGQKHVLITFFPKCFTDG